MVRRLAGVTLALLVSAVVFAGEGKDKQVTGTVKAVSAGSLTVMDSQSKDWTFVVDSKETLVVAKGGTHKMDQLKADGKPPVLTEFVSEKQLVDVRYYEKDGKMLARKVYVKQP